MTAEQIVHAILALPPRERQQVFASVRKIEAVDIPDDFVEALADFDAGRFVSMEQALNQEPVVK